MAPSIIYSHLRIVSYGWFARALAALLPVIWRSPSPLAHWHLLCRSEPNSFAGVGWGAMDFSPPFTQWQHGEVLWELGANELTLQCWGRCSVTQWGSQRTEQLGTLWFTGRVSTALSDRVVCLQSDPLSQMFSSFKMSQNIASALCLVCFIWFPGTAAKGGRENTGYLMDQLLYQLHYGMYHMTGLIEKIYWDNFSSISTI